MNCENKKKKYKRFEDFGLIMDKCNAGTIKRKSLLLNLNEFLSPMFRSAKRQKREKK